MTWTLDPPFNRGETIYKGTTIDPNNLMAPQLEGRVYDFPDEDFSTTVAGAKNLRTQRKVTCMVVRNVSGGNLLPKRLVTPVVGSGTGTDFLGRVDGYACLTNAYAFPVDEYLPSAGVVNNDLFYVVVAGPAKVLLPLAGTDFNGNVAVGSILVALTAATSGATTAGRAAVVNTTGSTQTADYSFILNATVNYIGRALSAATTGNTNADMLVDVEGRWF